jgi:hypothetical protein
MDQMIDRQMAAFASASVISQQGGDDGTWEGVDIELKNMDVLGASTEATATAAETPRTRSPDYVVESSVK